MKIVAIGNHPERVTYEGIFDSIDEAIETVTPKYGEFDTRIPVKENDELIYTYISNENIMICLIDADKCDCDIVFQRVLD